ncbi:MAG: hypothetical protein LBK45_00535 [Tannerellaceae bacterium]|jgi:hypothetical protein|nr:hypothetical protein [Tannerellaceae bacterium]
MEILINELSVSGQFASSEQFVNEALPPLVAALKEVDNTKDILLKKYDLFSAKIDAETSVYDIMVGPASRLYDEIRKFKSLLVALFENPYWEDSRQHAADCSYICHGNNVCNYSIAEACERDKVIISFVHPDFSMTQLSIIKNDTEIKVDNFFDKGHYTEIAWKREVLNCREYCMRKFAGGKLDFSKIDEKESFSLLKKEDERLFIDGFRKFTALSWQQIGVDDALDYKPYPDNDNIFKDIPYKIHKFRTSRKYRCFGYVDNGIFYVLRFDLEHKLSD